MQVSMKAKQIREIKSYRYFQLAPEDMNNLDDFEFVFSKDNAYKINIYTGETVWHEYSTYFTDYKKLVEGIPDDMDVLVDINVYRTWLDTKDKS
jgi:hypothetical protein